MQLSQEVWVRLSSGPTLKPWRGCQGIRFGDPYIEGVEVPNPAERAAGMLTANRFMTLATVDAAGVWSAPINYVIGPGPHLHFYSARAARHSMAISYSSQVAFSVFDTRASSEEVDGLQLSATMSAVSQPDELAAVHDHYFRVNFPDQETREWWWRPVQAFAEGATWAFYRLSIQEAFVINMDSIESERLDLRVSVDLDEMWSKVTELVSPAE